MCKKIALLIEPTWKPAHYEEALRFSSRFDYILSYRNSYFDASKHLYYPHGGAWVPDWVPQEKTRIVSMMISEKVGAPGHRLRHTLKHLFEDRITVYGRGYRPIASKVEALAPYHYSIIIEPERIDNYFTEKLIDCFLQRTIPIYWGSPTICDTFDCSGIIQFSSAEDIYNILPVLSVYDYNWYLAAIERNYQLAHNYLCVEDWIYTHYPFLFQE